MYKPALDHKCYFRVTAFVDDRYNHLDRYPRLLPSFEVVKFKFLYSNLHQDKVLFCITADSKAIDASIVSDIVCERLVISGQRFELLKRFHGEDAVSSMNIYLKNFFDPNWKPTFEN